MQRPGHSWSRPFSLMASASLSRVMGLLRCRVCEHAGVSCHVGTNRCMWVSIDSCGCLSPESHPQNRRSLETRPGERHPHAAKDTHTRQKTPTWVGRAPQGSRGAVRGNHPSYRRGAPHQRRPSGSASVWLSTFWPCPGWRRPRSSWRWSQDRRCSACRRRSSPCRRYRTGVRRWGCSP